MLGLSKGLFVIASLTLLYSIAQHLIRIWS